MIGEAELLIVGMICFWLSGAVLGWVARYMYEHTCGSGGGGG